MGRVDAPRLAIACPDSFTCDGSRSLDDLWIFGDADYTRTRGGAETEVDVHFPASSRTGRFAHTPDSDSAPRTDSAHTRQSWRSRNPV